MPIDNPASASSFNSPLVRALAWSCFSPTLICRYPSDIGSLHPPHFALTAARQHWLQQLDEDHSRLADYLAEHCRSTRLGLVYESLWHFFLSEDPQTTLTANNIPVRRPDGKTLGEFDIIYFCHQQEKHFHLELALKFFLALQHPQSQHSLSCWLGPNSADRLDVKLQRISEHQIPLSSTPYGKQTLAGLGVKQVSPQLQVGGMLFYGEHTPPASEWLNEAHPRGRWLTLGDFCERENRADWRHIQKPNWLNANFNSAEPIDDAMLTAAQSRPLLCINTHQQRCFIVPDQWPEI